MQLLGTPEPPPQPVMYDSDNVIGQTIGGKYRVLRLISSGGMGFVCEAVHQHTGRHVAIKLVSSVQRKPAAETIVRFEREARVAGSIDTEHIVQVFDAGTDEQSGAPFMVMELLAGEDLRALVKRLGPLPGELSFRIVAQACLGLAKAHDANVIHRDIKPGNLFLTDRDAGNLVVKLLDFGIAKVKMDQSEQMDTGDLTRTGTMLGSPQYMSPEQARGLKTVDFRTDIWSLGVVLYRMLAGRTPCQDLDTLGQIFVAICTEDPKPIRTFAPWVTPEASDVVMRALQRDPERRYPSIQAMYEAVSAQLPHGSSLTKPQLVPLSTDERARAAILPAIEIAEQTGELTNGGSDATQATLTGDAIPRPRRRRAHLVLLGAGVLAAGAVGLTAWTMTRPEPAPAATAAPVAAAVPTPEPTASVAPVATPSAPVDRTVKVQVAPKGAKVKVNGKPAKLKNGELELRGPLGSTHVVRVKLGAREIEQKVAITEAGPMPSKIELAAAPRAGGRPGQVSTPKPKPTKTGTTKPPSELGAATSLE